MYRISEKIWLGALPYGVMKGKDIVCLAPDLPTAKMIIASLMETQKGACSYCGEEYSLNQFIDKKGLTCYECAEDIESGEMENWLRADYNARCTL